jgi:8-oxoguanine deaminase
MTKAKRLWLKNPLSILANQAENGLVIENGIIAELVAQGKEPSQACDTIIDASQWVIIPGLINGHHHFYQTLTRALPQALNKPLFNWLTSLYPVWAGLEPEMVYESTRLALA